ncbi:MAG: DNA gyrase/topoisomerase IV subunit A [Bacteroidales bacterium]|nr:DNA gyrase/topoisomerase IV subunit A [Bacteroidales bacterium]
MEEEKKPIEEEPTNEKIADNKSVETENISLETHDNSMVKTTVLSDMFKNWFLDYASYSILDRAVPSIYDGLKPVQRRVLHSMSELEDGRFNKVANIVGNTMKYHPHGDASISDALVQLGQKNLLIDCQGNWGNILTGDEAAAARYIEARLSPFALDVAFNPKTTHWKLSYDGRNNEPIDLPIKFPLLLAQGVEGIAVGLKTKILPHNFNELIEASIRHLKGEPFELYPDFPTGGLADITRYNDGQQDGRVRVRARIKQLDKKTLVITEVPFGVTTELLKQKIIEANDRGKIKIRKIDDNTTDKVEILIHLAPNISPDQTIDALYAFTPCQVSIAPITCVIKDKHPLFLSISDILRFCTQHTVDLLRWELEIEKSELLEKLHLANLEKIFIEKGIYLEIRKTKSYEEMLETIDKGLQPYIENFYRSITRDDLIRLSEIPVKRTSLYNSFKADEHIKNLLEQLESNKKNLDNLINYTIEWFQRIQKKYGSQWERKTELRSFDNIEAARVAVANEKLYFDREEGFAGTALKKAEYVCDCSDIDDLIVFHADGTFKVTKVQGKSFVGTDVLHIAVFQRNDDRTIYNVVYQDGKQGKTYVKRFPVTKIVRDKEYNITKGTAGSKIFYLSANPNGEAEVVKAVLRPKPNLRKNHFDFDFSTLAIKSRNSQGNIFTKHFLSKVTLKEGGISTLGAINFFYDDTVKRLNTDGRGTLLGSFKGDDKILTLMASGNYKLHTFDVGIHFEEDMLKIAKFDPDQIFTVVYAECESEKIFIKRFIIDVADRKTTFLPEDPKTKLLIISMDECPQIEVIFDAAKNNKKIDNEIIDVVSFVDVKSIKAKGKRLSNFAIQSVLELDPLPPIEEEDDDEADNDDDSNELSNIIEDEEELDNEETSENTIISPNEESESEEPSLTSPSSLATEIEEVSVNRHNNPTPSKKTKTRHSSSPSHVSQQHDEPNAPILINNEQPQDETEKEISLPTTPSTTLVENNFSESSNIIQPPLNKEEEMKEPDPLNIEPIKNSEPFEETKPTDPPVIKQDIDDIPLEIVSIKKKKPKNEDDSNQMTLF